MAGIRSLFSPRHEPMPRLHHTSWQAGSKVLLYSGRTKDYSEKSKRRLSSAVDVFDLYTELWQRKKVTGESPVPGVFFAASASLDDDLFTFGGFDGRADYNSLHKLKGGLEWIELCPRNERAQSPMAKSGAGMVAFGDSLAVFGGFGIPHGPTQPGSSFITDTRYTDGAGWTNEFHMYKLKDDVWISPDITGERPSPRIGFSFTPIDNRRAVLFGGYNGEQGKMNDVYILDLLSMHWTKLSKSGDGPWPEERVYHAACCLNYGQWHPQLLVTGGANRQGKVLRDAWVLDVDSGRWRKVSGTLQPRRGHSVTAFSLVDGVTEVTMFGGTTDPLVISDEKLSKLADTTLLQFCCSAQSEWELRSVTKSSELGSEERVSVKKALRAKQERQVEKQLNFAEERTEMAEGRAQREEHRVQQERERAHYVQEREKGKEELLEQMVGRLDVVEGRKSEGTARESIQPAEGKTQQPDDNILRAERIVKGRKQERMAVQQLEAGIPQVVTINLSDLNIGDKKLGSGKFGRVYEGYWKKGGGMKVAVKVIQSSDSATTPQEIQVWHSIPPHRNIITLIGIASAQFLTYIITELAVNGSLFDNLHSERGNRPKVDQILVWASDVAHGMKHLHDHDVIHRDLKSANVLLTSGWVAKLCDFGSARQLTHTVTTEQTGTYRWMSPEIMRRTIARINKKCDLFSYGMILYELFALEIPYADLHDDVEVLMSVTSGKRPPIPPALPSYLRDLLKRCWEDDPYLRPTFDDFVSKIILPKSE